MPSKTKKQANFMRLCKNAPSKARKKCPPKKVSREFVAADKRKSRRKK